MPITEYYNMDECVHPISIGHVIAVSMFMVSFMTWLSWPIIVSGTANGRLVMAFNTDEMTHLEMMRQALNSFSLMFDFMFYGHLYFYMTLFPLMVASLFIEVTDQVIIIVLRIVPLLFAMGTAVLMFVFVQRFVGKWQAWLATAILVCVPVNFLRMATLSHPDMPQLFFLLLSLYYCCRIPGESGLKSILLASVAAGLAFACKYSGIFVLPVIFMTVLLTIVDRMPAPSSTGTGISSFGLIRVLLALGAVTSIIMAAVSNPDFVQAHLGVGIDGQTFGVQKVQILRSMRILSAGSGIVMAVAAVFNPLWTLIARHWTLALLIKRSLYVIVAFSITFLLVSPYSFYRLNIVKGLLYESAHTSYGDWFKEGADALEWFGILSSDTLLDPFILAFVALGFISFVLVVLKEGRIALISYSGILWVWTLFFLFFVLFRVKVKAPRYILPLIPSMIILFVKTLGDISTGIKRRLPSTFLPFVAPLVVLLVLAVEIPGSFRGLAAYRTAMASKENISVAVTAGRWLEDNYPGTARILHDHYSYVPPCFKNVQETWGGTLELLRRYSPDVVVVQSRVSENFEDGRKGAHYSWGQLEFSDIRDYYLSLREHRTEYRLVRDFGETKIYERTR